MRQYKASLQDYVEGGGEAALSYAYELGRQAVAEGLGVLHMVGFYHEALLAVLQDTLKAEGSAQASKAKEFFTESLAPFEMVHRGFRETNAKLRESNEALQEINSELEAFSYTVSHDLRAPLRHMQGFAQALLDDYSQQLDPVAKDYAQRIVTAASRMDNLIQDLLDYGRLGRAYMRLRPLGLVSAVADVLIQVNDEVRRLDAQVSVEIPPLEVLGDRTILERILINLLTNAVKFVPVGMRPEVRISAEEHGTWVRLWVRDNGIGIPLEQQEHIFEVFRRLHDSKTYPGTGIGLAIVRRGVARMGGRVGVESAPGKGSAFWLELKRR
jgi:signal transduction histidine kinase